MGKNDNLDSLFQEWKKHYESIGIDAGNFSDDGIINEELYNQAPKKLLFVLRETNDFSGGDLRELFKNGPVYPTFHQLARWAAGIFKSFPPYERIDNFEVMKWAIQSVAVMNLKKITGGSRTDFNMLNVYAFADKKFITEQVQIVNPDLLICCNTFIETMWSLDIEDIKNYIKCDNVLFKRFFNYANIKIVPYPHHPGDRKSHEANYNELSELFKTIGLANT